jgi:hypothetical protein
VNVREVVESGHRLDLGRRWDIVMVEGDRVDVVDLVDMADRAVMESVEDEVEIWAG